MRSWKLRLGRRPLQRHHQHQQKELGTFYPKLAQAGRLGRRFPTPAPPSIRQLSWEGRGRGRGRGGGWQETRLRAGRSSEPPAGCTGASSSDGGPYTNRSGSLTSTPPRLPRCPSPMLFPPPPTPHPPPADPSHVITLTPATAYFIGRGFVRFLKARSGSSSGSGSSNGQSGGAPVKVCVGTDPRLSGPLIKAAVVVGLADEGAEVS